MKNVVIRVSAVASLLLSDLQPVWAGSMRCGVNLIHDQGLRGSGKYEVLKKCGEPAYRQGNTWVYENKRRVVRFADSGQISSIQSSE